MVPNVIFFVLLFIHGWVSLDCHFGTPDSLSTCTVQTAFGQDSCISASFTAPFAPSATPIYTCGTCAVFSDPSFAPIYGSVTCCNSSDFCQTVASPSANTTCDFITTEDSCQTRPDCYWCAGSPTTTLNGFGLCKSYVGFAFGPCWAVPLVLPPPICDTISCQPADPAYTVDVLTLQFLLDYGFPAIAPENVTIGIGLDVLSRLAETKILNDTSEFCLNDIELQEWCGFNNTSPFTYCVVSETWPQTDIMGWLSNTTFSSPSNLLPLYPSFCACPIAGRAYYIPDRQVDVSVKYGPACGNEHAILAFFILLLVVTTLCFLYVLWDTGLLIVFSFQGKKGFSLGKTFPVKICLILYFLVTIPDQVIITVPAYGRTVFPVVGGVLKLLAIVFLLYAFALATFAFIEILIEAKLFGSKKSVATSLTIYKWAFLAIFGFLLFCCIGILSAVGFYLQKASEFRDTNLVDYAQTGEITKGLFKTQLLLLVIVEGLMIILTGALLIFVTYSLINISSGSRVRGLRDLIARDIALIFSLIVSIPHLGILCTILVYATFILLGDLQSPQATKYLTNEAYFWITWAQYVTELIWVMAIAYAMRTVVKKSWLVGQFKAMFSIDSGASSGNLSSGSATTNEQTYESRL